MVRALVRLICRLLALVFLIPSSPTLASEVRYVTAYDVDARRAIFGTLQTVDRCPPAPPALPRIEIPGYYENYEEWSRQGKYARKWASGSVALSYLKIRDQSGLDEDKRKSVGSWIGRLADVVKDSSTGETSRRNNHAYWNGMTNMANGILLNRRDLFESGIGAYKLALNEMRSDGTLPLELDRKEHALHYHNFALSPLIFIAELAAKQGFDLYRERSRSNLNVSADGGPDVHKLVDLVIRCLEDPGYFRKFSPIRQAMRKGKISDHIGDLELTWIEPYYGRFKEPRLVPSLCKLRPLYNWRTGGDATLGWGVKELAC